MKVYQSFNQQQMDKQTDRNDLTGHYPSIFRYLNPVPTRVGVGGRFSPPSQRSQLSFPCGYVPVKAGISLGL